MNTKKEYQFLYFLKSKPLEPIEKIYRTKLSKKSVYKRFYNFLEKRDISRIDEEVSINEYCEKIIDSKFEKYL